MANQNLKTVKNTLVETADAFTIDDGITPPSRNKEIPDYGLPAVFAKLQPGQSVLLPFARVPVEHARILAQRLARGPKGGSKIDLTTRTEKDADGNAVGLRVWRNS